MKAHCTYVESVSCCGVARKAFGAVAVFTAVLAQGWNMVCKDGDCEALSVEELDARIAERDLELTFLDGMTWQRVTSLSKPVRKALAAETHVLTVESPRFIFGQGINE